MDDLGGMIQNFLSQPGAMDQLEDMAKQLGLAGGDASLQKPDMEMIQPEMLNTVMKLMGEASGQDNITGFLLALKEILRPERQAKVDRAIRALNLIRAAKTVSSVAELRGE